LRIPRITDGDSTDTETADPNDGDGDGYVDINAGGDDCDDTDATVYLLEMRRGDREDLGKKQKNLRLLYNGNSGDVS